MSDDPMADLPDLPEMPSDELDLTPPAVDEADVAARTGIKVRTPQN